MGIYQHFRKHEHPFVDQVLSWKEQVERTFTVYLTDFLDPREQLIVQQIIGTTNEEVTFAFSGGYEQAERKRAVIAPYYTELTEDDFSVTLLEGTFPDKFMRIEHRDILGAYMSLGMDRKKLGDILVNDGIFQFFLVQELSAYVRFNLTQIKQASIQLSEPSFHKVIDQHDQWVERQETVSSLRLDVLVKEIYRLSRKNAHELIKSNRVKVNHTNMDDPSIQLMEHDLISVQGYGRSKLLEIGNQTRKNKLKITTARLKT